MVSINVMTYCSAKWAFLKLIINLEEKNGSAAKLSSIRLNTHTCTHTFYQALLFFLVLPVPPTTTTTTTSADPLRP